MVVMFFFFLLLLNVEWQINQSMKRGLKNKNKKPAVRTHDDDNDAIMSTDLRPRFTGPRVKVVVVFVLYFV